MFVGHSLLAFALVGVLARRRGVAAERALVFAGLAALFAAAPDADVLFAVHGFASAAPIADFWAATTVTHRAVTHSLVLALPAALLAGLTTAGLGGAERTGSNLALVGVALGTVVSVAGVFAVGGALAGALFTAFVLAVIAVAALGAHLDATPQTVAAVALVGLATHPFGDLFTGTPPAMLWPLEVTLVADRVAPFADPTLDFLLAFGVELAAIWAGVLVALALAGLPIVPTLRRSVRTRAVLGAAYAGTLFVLPLPTVDFAYLFVFSIIPVGAVGVEGRRARSSGAWLRTVLLTGLSAVTVAVVAYGAAYVFAI